MPNADVTSGTIHEDVGSPGATMVGSSREG